MDKSSRTSDQREPQVILETLRLTEFDSAGLAHVVAGAEFEHRRLPGGGSDINLLQCALPNAVIDRGIYAPAVLVNGTFSRNTITLGLMLRQQQPTLVNGVNVKPGTVQFYAENSEMCYRAWPDATWLAFVISHEHLLRFCLEYFDAAPNLPDTGIIHIEPKSIATGSHLLAALRDLDRSLRPLSKECSAARLGESVERDLLAAFPA